MGKVKAINLTKKNWIVLTVVGLLLNLPGLALDRTK